VDDVVLMRIRESRGDFAQNPDGFGYRQLAAFRESRAQRLSAHVRHREKRQPVRLTRCQQRDDVWMLELCCELDFAAEAVDADRSGHLLREDFYYDLATELRLMGEEHARHAAAPKLLLENVPVTESCLELIAQIGQ